MSESASLTSGSSGRGGYAAIASDSDVEHGHSHGVNGGGDGYRHSHGPHGSHSHSHSHGGKKVSPRMSPRSAYQRGDADASRAAHEARRNHQQEEGHSETGEYIKSIVYGGLDGIITTFATVTSVAGAEFSAAVIVVLGISHLFADGLSMGLGDYMSSQAELDYTASERKREQWEMDVNMKGEIEEMVDLYVEKGVSEHDARVIINTLAKYPQAFLDHMMVEELGLLPPDADEGFSPSKAGLVTMASFMLFGSIPLLPYLIALLPGVHMSADLQLWLSVGFTIVTLFALGAFKGMTVEIKKSAWWKSGTLMAFNGSVAAVVGYLSGYLISQWMDLPAGAG